MVRSLDSCSQPSFSRPVLVLCSGWCAYRRSGGSCAHWKYWKGFKLWVASRWCQLWSTFHSLCTYEPTSRCGPVAWEETDSQVTSPGLTASTSSAPLWGSTLTSDNCLKFGIGRYLGTPVSPGYHPCWGWSLAPSFIRRPANYHMAPHLMVPFGLWSRQIVYFDALDWNDMLWR